MFRGRHIESSRRTAASWSLGLVTLDVEVFDHSGIPVRDFRVEHPWFDGVEQDRRARVQDVVHTVDGAALVLIAREREGWEPPVQRSDAEDRAPIALSHTDIVQRWEQQMLLVDRSGEVVLSSPSPADLTFIGFADAEHVYGYRAEDELVIRVWRARLATSASTVRGSARSE